MLTLKKIFLDEERLRKFEILTHLIENHKNSEESFITDNRKICYLKYIIIGALFINNYIWDTNNIHSILIKT